MWVENIDFTTASWVSYKKALESGWILTQWTHFGHFSVSHSFIDKIAKFSRSDNKIPDENTLGRECYSFSERENRAFVIAMREAEALVSKINALWWWKCSMTIETDTIWNLYMRVKWEKESKWEEFETHMQWSHLDSVQNGGKYDGVAGIAAGLETLQQVLFHQSQGQLQNSFCLTIFRSEESSPNNGVACLGSAIATGTIEGEKLESVVYTNQNGQDVLLRDYLESSLQKYFQSIPRDENGNQKWELIWWEGNEYIDHEWWYWFCQQHGITAENYKSWDWWNKILELQQKPKITKENTASYRELHIEQGKLIAGANVDLGIVSGGIGGAKRYKTMTPVSVDTQEVSPEDYEVYSFTVQWFADHTGSTPNNLSLESAEYRKDAQIATNLFLRAFLEQHFWELISSEVDHLRERPNPEWYTKVPFQQRITLAIKKGKQKAFKAFLRAQKCQIEETNWVQFSELNYVQEFLDLPCISRDSAKQQIGALLWISETASNEFGRQREENPEEKKFGTTRATLTNVKLTPDGLSFFLDVREVDTDDVEQLLKWISREISRIISEGIEWLQKVSEKVHEGIDETRRDKSKAVADILGYTSIFLPSIPGHDADRIAAAWIPISMTFVRQEDGISHNPQEKMEKQAYNKAAHLWMTSTFADLL